MEKKEVNLNEIGNWEVFSMGAGCGEHKAIVYETTLRCAIKVGCTMIGEEYGKHYAPASSKGWNKDTIRYDGSDPWYVDVKKANNVIA